MTRLDCEAYREDLTAVADLHLPWNLLSGKTLLVSGSTGMIGSFLIDVLMEKNRDCGLGCKVVALTRDPDRAAARAVESWRQDVRFLGCDVSRERPEPGCPVDYVIHAASNTHPVAYATDPIGTITTNILGAQNMLDTTVRCQAKRMLFLSSVEIYGENRGDTEYFDESYCGYLDCNTLRAGYPEGKRAGEALCQAYIRQEGVDAVIIRLPRVFGPTVLTSDTKAISQFLKKGVAGENIVLKSKGTQLYSYSYVADAVSGILYCLLQGKIGEAYNLADPGCDITLRELAELIADCAGKKVVFELPDQTEKAGYSKATKALMNAKKLKALGWQPRYDMKTAIPRTIQILATFQDSAGTGESNA